MSRLSRDAWALRLAEVTALRGTCLRRQVGCVLLDARGRVLATGYNGVAAGIPHCNEKRVGGVPYNDPAFIHKDYPHACPGATAARGQSHLETDPCQAVHAELNALLQCRDVREIETCYSTTEPCVSCTKALLNTNCRRVVFREPYPNGTGRDLFMSRSTKHLPARFTPGGEVVVDLFWYQLPASAP